MRTVNRPVRAFGNYSKPLQLRKMAALGFTVPRTLVTNDKTAARQFILEEGGAVILKGVSSVPTTPRLLSADDIGRLDGLTTCPTQFQQYISGDDIRVSVVDAAVVVTRVLPGTTNERKCVADKIPDEVADRCIRFTRQQRLVVSGIDLRRTVQGYCAFEINLFPEFTYFEDQREPLISRLIAGYLFSHRDDPSDVAA